MHEYCAFVDTAPQYRTHLHDQIHEALKSTPAHCMETVHPTILYLKWILARDDGYTSRRVACWKLHVRFPVAPPAPGLRLLQT